MPENMATGCKLPFSKFITAATSIARKPLYAFHMGKTSISQSPLAIKSNSGKSPLRRRQKSGCFKTDQLM